MDVAVSLNFGDLILERDREVFSVDAVTHIIV
jgi:hypothetical protein